MNRFQPISFRNVADLLDYLPPGELKIVERLRTLVFECLPDAHEKLAYNVPFYYRRSRICYIWPGAVPWSKKEKQGVELGFCKGHLLPDPSWLESNGRKEVYTKTFHSTRDIDAGQIRALLYAALVIDSGKQA